MLINSGTAVALGSFDGLHKGHMSVIACALAQREHGLVPTVLLFDSHPLLTLKGFSPDVILQNSLRDQILDNLDITSSFISFSEIKDYSPEEFFEHILLNKLRSEVICCGWNYRFGKNGSGNVNTLEQLCAANNKKLIVVPHVDYDDEPISSSRIRNLIINGNIEDANKMLGRAFSYTAIVKCGHQRGRLIGAPTINQYFDEGFIKPKSGVYASYTTVDGVDYPSVTNIGLRPSFENEDFRSETYILNFDGDLYGQNIEVHLLKYIRPEEKFDSLNTLKIQIASDTEMSVNIFDSLGDNAYV